MYKIEISSMSSEPMLLDQIWKQQLSLVTYGNAYLQHNLDFNLWLNHPVFDQQVLQFRDLSTQYLLAQHFKIWLEGLKKQGVQRLSLHSSAILHDEKNPNPNVELLAYAHFIVSHSPKQKHAWICGRELPLWELSEQEFQIPNTQKISLKQDVFWRFELTKNLIQRVEVDFAPAQWDEIRSYLNTSLFHQPILQDCIFPVEHHTPYTGQNQSDEASLALFPRDYPAEFVHQTLHRFDALKDFIYYKIQHPYAENGEILNPEQQLELRDLNLKIDELQNKFIVKAANHYQSAQILPETNTTPFTQHPTSSTTATKMDVATSANKTNVFKLIMLTVLICALAYYFGL